MRAIQGKRPNWQDEKEMPASAFFGHCVGCGESFRWENLWACSIQGLFFGNYCEACKNALQAHEEKKGGNAWAPRAL